MIKKLSAAVIGFLLLAVAVKAGTGTDGADWIQGGSYNGSFRVAITNNSSTLVVSASNKRPDETCFNNTGFAIFIGSNAASSSLYGIGFPILSSSTFNASTFSGSIYAITDPAATAGEVRCYEGLVP